MDPQLEQYFDRLWPISRSLTGDGNRETLNILSEIVDLKLTEVPSGKACFDWAVPPEWNIREAWIKDSKGAKIIDFATNNLHILGYSQPFHDHLSFEELKSHLYTLPNQPDLIPYLTSYYQKRWGFCLSQNQFDKIDQNQKFEVFIDSELNQNGSMTVAEAFLPGKTKKEILLSTYICHPSMANNELSGPLVTAMIYQHLKTKEDRNYSYRFLFHPETIGAIYHLGEYGEFWKKHLHAGYVLTCVGDKGAFTYKKSRQENSTADLVAKTVLTNSGKQHKIIDFFPRGSDERQFCSPGFNLPIGSLMRTMYGEYDEYHTSGDNKELISFKAMQETVEMYLQIINRLEKTEFETVEEKNQNVQDTSEEYYTNLLPNCEPQLGKRNLYPTLSEKTKDNFVEAMMWLLNYSDGKHSLSEISIKSGIEKSDFYPVINKLKEKGILIDSFQ